MSAPHKVITRYSLPDDLADLARKAYSATPPQQSFSMGNAGAITVCLGAIYKEAIDRELRELRTESLADARAWLALSGRDPQELLNVYLHLDHRRARVVGTWTFSNRESALLFKLS